MEKWSSSLVGEEVVVGTGVEGGKVVPTGEGEVGERLGVSSGVTVVLGAMVGPSGTGKVVGLMSVVDGVAVGAADGKGVTVGGAVTAREGSKVGDVTPKVGNDVAKFPVGEGVTLDEAEEGVAVGINTVGEFIAGPPVGEPAGEGVAGSIELVFELPMPKRRKASCSPASLTIRSSTLSELTS